MVLAEDVCLLGLVCFHWLCVGVMPRPPVEIIRLYSDEDQAHLFIGVLSTSSTTDRPTRWDAVTAVGDADEVSD